MPEIFGSIFWRALLALPWQNTVFLCHRNYKSEVTSLATSNWTWDSCETEFDILRASMVPHFGLLYLDLKTVELSLVIG